MAEFNRLRALGYCLAVVAVSFWAASGNLAKHLFEQGVGADDLTTVRLVIASVVLWGVAWMGRGGLPNVGVVAALPPRGSGLLLLAFGLSLWAMMFTFFQAVAQLGVALGIILQYTHPALIIIFSWFILRRATGFAAYIAVGCAMAGIMLIVGFRATSQTDQTLGFVWGLASAVANAVYLLLGSHIQKRFGSGPSLLYGFSIACLAALLWGATQESTTLSIVLQSPNNMLVAIAIGIFGTLGAFALMVVATRYISPLEAGLTSGLEAVFAGVIAAWWFGERLTGLQALGAALVLGGVALSYLRGPETKSPSLLQPTKIEY